MKGGISKEEYRLLVEKAPIMMWRSTAMMECDYFSEVWLAFTGRSLEQEIGNGWAEGVHPEDSDKCLKTYSDHFARREPFEMTYRLRRFDGAYRWVFDRGAPYFDTENNFKGYIGSCIDATETVEAQNALRESEQRFRSIFMNSLDGMMVTTIDGGVLSANEKMCEMLGMSEEEIIEAGRDGIAVKDEKLAAGIEERLRTGRFRGELTLRRKDGSLLPVEISVSVFRDLAGAIKSGQVVRDISKQKRAEQLLRRTHEELEARVEQRTAEIKRHADLLDLAHDAIIVRDGAGRISFWNSGAEETYGWTKDEAVGRMAQDLLRTEFSVPLQELMDKALREGRWEGELVHTCRDGRQIVVLSRWGFRREEHGGQVEVMEVNSDITLRKEAEEALRRAGAYNRTLIEAGLDPLVTIGPGGAISDVNAATEQITGYLRSELIGTDFADYFTDPERAREGHARVFKEGLVRDYELEMKHRDGHSTPVLYNASLFMDESGDIAGILAAARDITERKRADEMLLDKSRALEEANTALKVLINHYKNDHRELEERIVSNIKARIIPYVEELKRTRLDAGQSGLIEVIERNFRDLASPFLKEISSEHLHFTPKEIEIISLIKDGKTTKEIAQTVSLGKRTIDAYRDSIRDKLGLTNKKVNLRTYLLSFGST